eukprot:1393377-Alexandrium_andersonii.AAC.1
MPSPCAGRVGASSPRSGQATGVGRTLAATSGERAGRSTAPGWAAARKRGWSSRRKGPVSTT